MAIQPQLANHAETESTTPLNSTVEQLKVQAKIQMALTTAELDNSISGLDSQHTLVADHIPHSPAPVDGDQDLSSSAEKKDSGLEEAKAASKGATPAASRSLPPPHIAKSIPCRFFAIGNCKYGDTCAFSHASVPNHGAVAILPGMSNGHPTASAHVDTSNGNGLPSVYNPHMGDAFRPHPAQSYEEAAMRRYYGGYCDSNSLPPPPEQPHPSAPLPPSTSSTPAPAEVPMSANDQPGYYPPPGHLPQNYDGYYPPGPPPSAGVSHGFPTGEQVEGYAPGNGVDGNPNVYYPFPGPMPPHMVYGPMPIHCPQGYYGPPPPGSEPVLDGYQMGHPVGLGHEDPSIPPAAPHPQPPQEDVYYPQYYPTHPSTECLPFPPINDYVPQQPITSDPDSAIYPPFIDPLKDETQLPFRPVEGYPPPVAPFPTHQPTHASQDSYIAGPGAPPSTKTNRPHPVDHSAPAPGVPRFHRNGTHGMNNSKRGFGGRGGGRPLRPRPSFNNGGPGFGGPRPPSAGLGHHGPHPRPSASSTAGPVSVNRVTSLSALAAVPPEERGPRGPCSFFAENRCRFGDECLWAHVMPNGDDAREYRLNYVGPESPSKDGVLGSEVGFGNKMTRKMDGFDSRAIPGYALWEKKYKDPNHKTLKEKAETPTGGNGNGESNKQGGLSLDVRPASASIRQKVDEIVQQRREGNIPGSQAPTYKMSRSSSSGPPRPSQQAVQNAQPQPHLKYATASNTRAQRVPSGEDFPALRPHSAISPIPEKSSNHLGIDSSKAERRLEPGSNDEETSSNSGATEASASTNATSTKDLPTVRKPTVIEGGSFALAAARGASAVVPTKQTKSISNNRKSSVTPAAVSSTTPVIIIEDAMKALEINSSTTEVAAST